MPPSVEEVSIPRDITPKIPIARKKNRIALKVSILIFYNFLR